MIGIQDAEEDSNTLHTELSTMDCAGYVPGTITETEGQSSHQQDSAH